MTASSELLEQAKKLVMENKRLKDVQIMLSQQVEGKVKFHTMLCKIGR
jgi:hypothetical protein